MKSLLGMSLVELQDVVAQHNMPKFTAKQLVDWLYRKRIATFDEMTNLSKQTRQILAENYETGYRRSRRTAPRSICFRLKTALSRRRIFLKKNVQRFACRARWDAK